MAAFVRNCALLNVSETKENTQMIHNSFLYCLVTVEEKNNNNMKNGMMLGTHTGAAQIKNVLFLFFAKG